MLLNLRFFEDDLVSENLLKNSAVRSLFLKLQNDFSNFSKTCLTSDKKISVIKCRNKLEIYRNQSSLIFLNPDNTLYVPFLQIIHKYPSLLPEVFLDLGALAPVLKGADIMCPGLLKKDFYLKDGLKENELVAIRFEGMTHAAAIGRMILSTEQIRSTKKGKAIENVLRLNDDLWKLWFKKEEALSH